MIKAKLLENSNLLRRVSVIAIIAFMIYISLAFWGDISQIKGLITSIPLQVYGICIAIALFGYIIRAIKWYYSLKVLNIHIPFSRSAQVFFIGMAFAISPGKLGELIKSYYLKKNENIDLTKTIPIFFTDHLTSLFAWLICIIFTFNSSLISYQAFILFCFLVTVFFVIIRKKSYVLFILNKFGKIKFLQKYKPHIIGLYENTDELLKWKTLLVTTCLSLITTLTECIPLFLLLQAIQEDISLTHSIFIVGTSTIAATLSMIPGGIGVVEGSVVGFLMFLDINKSTAVSVSLLERLIVLWFGVFIGFVVLFVNRKMYITAKR